MVNNINENKKVNIAVMVSGGGTNLQALIDSKVIKHGFIKLVLSNNENAFALERAKKHNIQTYVISKKSHPNDFEQSMIDILKQNEIDLIVMAGFLTIVDIIFINEFKNRIINIHPSLIPSFCGEGYYGIRVHEAALEKGVKITGATTHFVNEIPDGGEIIMQKSVKVREDDTPKSLQERVMQEAEWKILPLSVEKICKQILKENKIADKKYKSYRTSFEK